MKVHELSKKLKISSKELLNRINDPRVTSHLSKIPADILSEFDVEEKKISEAKPEPAKTVDRPKAIVVEPVVETKSKEACPYTKEEVELGCRGCGVKSPMWKWRNEYV